MSEQVSHLKKICTAMLLTAVLLLSGCEDISSADVTTDTDVSVTSLGEAVLSVGGEGGETLPEGYPVVINDTEIRTPPEKVICLSGGLAEMIYELGFGDKLIGRGSYCEYPEQVTALADHGRPTAPDLEGIKKAAPDVVLTATRMQSRDIVLLSESGIKVVYIPASRSLDEFGRVYCALGMMFEGMFDGEEIGNKAFYAVKNKLSESGIELGRFVYITEGLRAAGGDTFEGSVLSLFGTNAAETASGYSYDVMQLIAAPPDVVILNSEISLAELAVSDSIGFLAAGRVISVSNSYFESPSGRLTELADELADKLAETGGDPE